MSSVLVLDNGAGTLKIGIGGDRDPLAVVPNCVSRSPHSKKPLIADEILSTPTLTSSTLRRPIDRGCITNIDLQRTIWSHLFSSLALPTPCTSSLLLTLPHFSLSFPTLRRPLFEMIFEDFGFRSLCVSDSGSLVHMYETARSPGGVAARRGCSVVVDCGFSFLNSVPVVQGFGVNYGVKRVDFGGKALTNWLKELVSYRAVDVRDETLIVDDVKERLCFISLDVERDLKIARYGCDETAAMYKIIALRKHENVVHAVVSSLQPPLTDVDVVGYLLVPPTLVAKAVERRFLPMNSGAGFSMSFVFYGLDFIYSYTLTSSEYHCRRPGKDNLFRCTYVLPDGVTHTKGFVKHKDEAHRYLSLYDGVVSREASEKPDIDMADTLTKPVDRKTFDLTKNEFSLTNERFLVPEMIFHPADLGINQAGLAECIVRSVNACNPLLHPVLYESIILTGGSTLFPQFAQRLEKELRPLVPDAYKVKITTQEDPILGVWRGGSLLASSPEFEAMCVTKADYEEQGSTRCSRRFFQ
ncbi:Actin-related protein [Drosera capensis]